MMDKIAKVLEQVADYIEHTEVEKYAEAQAEKEHAVIKIAQAYTNKTGQEPSDNLLKQLMGTSTEELTKMAELIESKNDFSLGQPSMKADYSNPTTVKSAAENAERAFLDWILE